MINKAIKLIRQYHNVNQSQMAEKLSISTSYLSELESGKKEPTLDLLQKYSTLFDVPLSSLIIFTETLSGLHSKSKARSFISKKMLKILEWIADQNEQVPNSRDATV